MIDVSPADSTLQRRQTVTRDPARITTAVADLPEGSSNGGLEVTVGSEFPLEDAAAAHRFIEDRKGTEKSS